MNETKARSADWYLLVVSLVADVLGILGFIGLKASGDLRWIVAGALAVLGILAALTTLYTAIALWLSPRGSYYTTQFHARRIGIGLIALVLSAALAVAAFHTAATTAETPQSPSTPSATPRA